MRGSSLLAVEGLGVSYAGASAPALQACSFALGEGETLAVVGASGCGKTTLTRALLGLLPAGAARVGRLRWRGAAVEREVAWRGLRGREIGLVLQDPQTALNPVLRIGEQVAAPLRHHFRLSRREAWTRAVALLDEVRLPDAADLARRYPHELSGGQRQRVGLAAALAAAPALLVADEPTSSLDLIAQRGILELLRDLQRSRGLALIFVTHDLPLVPVVAERLLVLDQGRVVESGRARGVLAAPAHPATQALLAPLPAASAPPPREAPVLVARGLTVQRWRGGVARTVIAGLDFELYAGEMVGLAGVSGCGKTTLARALAGQLPASGVLQRPRDGSPRAVQLVFQDPAAALDPRQTVMSCVAEAARATGEDGEQARRTAHDLLAEVGVPGECATAYPHELSVGQQRRVVLARALAADPVVLIADEPTASLDPPARARVLALLGAIQRRRGLAILLISHDLPLLRQVCQRVAVMDDGALAEVFAGGSGVVPQHPASLALASAAPGFFGGADESGGRGA